MSASFKEDQFVKTLNRRLLHVAATWRPNVLFVYKGIEVLPDTLAQIPCLRLHYHPDDSANDQNVSDWYRGAEDMYQVHVTTKKHNVGELRRRTSSQVVYVECAFDPRWHFNARATFEPRLGFVGTMRPDRVALVSSWARVQQHTPMLVVGAGWRGSRALASKAEVVGPQYGVDMALAIAKAPIQLGALNSDNRDTHTCRTFEVPASGGLFVGQATEDHSHLFSHGRDALLWGSEAESVEHAAWALSHSEEAERIATRGCAVIRSGSHTYVDRARQIMSAVAQH